MRINLNDAETALRWARKDASKGHQTPEKIALIEKAESGLKTLENHADLFSAAPETAAERDRLKAINADLLKVLKRFEAWACGKTGTFTIANIQGIVCEASAAITKAEGE